MIVTIDNWVNPLAQHFKDPLLSPESLQALRQKGLIRLVREEWEILALAAAIPLTQDSVLLAGVWVSQEYDHMEMAQSIVSQAIAWTHERGATMVIPEVFLGYVRHETKAPKDLGWTLEDVLKDMTSAGIPRRHGYRSGGLKIVPAKNPEEGRWTPRVGSGCNEL